MKKYLVPLSIAALLLTGCSSDPAESDASEQEPTRSASAEPTADTETTEEADTGEQGSTVSIMGPGSYTFESEDGAAGTLEVPGELNPEIEEYRIAAGSQPVAYLTGNLDNRTGTEFFDVYTITMYDAEGNEYAYQPAQDYLSEVAPSSEESAEAYNAYVDLQNSLTTVFDPLERGDFIMVGPEVPEEITGIMINNGFEDFPAAPAN